MSLVILLILFVITLQGAAAWGHIAMWNSWSWLYLLDGSAWLTGGLFALLVGFLGRIIYVPWKRSGLDLLALIVMLSTIIVTIVGIFVPLCTFNGFFDGLLSIILLGVMVFLSAAICSGANFK